MNIMINVSYSIVQKDTFAIEIDILDDKTGKPVNLSGYTIFFIVKKQGDTSPDDSLAKINLQFNITDGTNGTILISLNSSQTDLPVNTYRFDLITQQSTLSRKTRVQGLLNITRSGKQS